MFKIFITQSYSISVFLKHEIILVKSFWFEAFSTIRMKRTIILMVLFMKTSFLPQIFLPRSNNSALTSTTVVLTKNTKSVSQINVSDTEMTILFNIKPSINVSLAVFLSYESPPNSTYFHNSTILKHTGNHH